MKANLLLLFLLIFSQTSLFALHQDIEQLGSFGEGSTKVEVYSAIVDTSDPNSEKNKKILESFEKDLGLKPDVPVLAETISESEAARAGVEPLTEKNVKEFIESYQLKNEVYPTEISKEVIDFIETGDLPEKFNKEIAKSLADPSWETSKEYKIYKDQVTPSNSVLGKRFGLSKSTSRLTVIRMVFNAGANILSASISRRFDLRALLFGAMTSTMTGAVQVNNKFFEKLMASKYAKLKFFGIEAAFVGVSILGSAALFGVDHEAVLTKTLLEFTNTAQFVAAKYYSWIEYAIDIFGFGLATTYTQGRAEELAAKQVDRLKGMIDKEIIRVQNSTTLSSEAKNTLTDILIVKRANLTETFSRVMLGGSMIWTKAIALGATLPGAAGMIAGYAVFGVLHLYANTIKYVGSDKMMNFRVKDYEKGIIDFWKAQFQAPGKFMNKVANKFKKLVGRASCNSNFLK